jgi:NADPH:quinone reductase-like Zn-dependent oxidoreductase
MRVHELRGAGLDQLVSIERPMPEPGPGQVLVRVHAVSLNYRDLLIAQGKYGRGALRYPLVPVSDGAGEVVEVGAGVTRVAPGDRVAGTFFQNWTDGPFEASAGASALGGSIDGVLAEQVVLSAEGVVKFPSELSFEEAATLPCAALTAWVSLVERGRLEPDERVLVMGTGGVSVFALQFAKSLGAQVIVTSRSDEKLARAKSLGADGLVNTHKMPDWDAGVRELTIGRGVDHLIEVGGAETLQRSLRCLRDGGHLALVGLLSGAPARREDAENNQRGIRVDSIYVGSRQHFEAMNNAITRFEIRPVIDRAFTFDEARAAYEYLASGQHFGKIVIRI